MEQQKGQELFSGGTRKSVNGGSQTCLLPVRGTANPRHDEPDALIGRVRIGGTVNPEVAPA